MNKVYQIVTDRIISSLESGVVPWRKSWSGFQVPMNYISKREYSGINVVLTSLHEFSSPYFVSYKQCLDLGGQVRKGEHGFMITYWNTFEDKVLKNGEEKTKNIPFIRYYTVFNTDQCDGLNIEYGINTDEEDVDSEVRKFIQKFEEKVCKIESDYSITIPMWITTDHKIIIQSKEKFETNADFCQSLFHEMIHATGRALRDIVKASTMDKNQRAEEELIAEIGACFLMNYFKLDCRIDNSSAYIEGWIKCLKESKENMIVSCASKAQKAVNYLLGEKDEVEE